MQEGDSDYHIDPYEWSAIQSQLQCLREENEALKSYLSKLEREQISPHIRSSHSMTQSHICSPNDVEKSQLQPKSHFQQQMKEWSNKINILSDCQATALAENHQNLDKIQEEKEIIGSCESFDSVQVDKNAYTLKIKGPKETSIQHIQYGVQKEQSKKQKQEEKINESKSLKLIDSICLYGPSQKQLQEIRSDRKFQCKSSLLFCNLKQKQEQYNKFSPLFYPSGNVTVRNLKQSQINTQVNQIIFRKNVKNQDCSLFTFKKEVTQSQKKNPVLQKVNPGKWQFGFVIQFPDFQVVDIQNDYQSPFNKSASEKEQKKQLKVQTEKDEKSKQQSDRTAITKPKQNAYTKSVYTLCIFTSFPFIQFFQNLISSILDQIKIRRFQIFAQKNQAQNVSIDFFKSQLQLITLEVTKQIQNFEVVYQSQTNILFSNFNISLNLLESKMNDNMLSGWIFDVIKLFEKDILYQIFTNLMSQQSICFVCENMHLLSYVIFLFVNVMLRPFVYPYECINQITDESVLCSSSTLVSGIQQNSKWIQDSAHKYHKVVFIDLNDEVKIKGKKKLKSIKSEKLRKIFSNFYKKLEPNTPLPQIFKKKQKIIRPPTKEQVEITLSFLSGLQCYFSEQIFSHLPNPEIVNFLKQKSVDDTQLSKMMKILKQIQKYFKQSRKQKEKDPFIEMLAQQKIFYSYISELYCLNC